MAASGGRIALLLGAVLLVSPRAAPAHNGAVALALPVSGIAIDGDLSDWPDDVTRYPIREAGFVDQHPDPADLEADVRIGYNRTEGALYLAIHVRDDSVVVGASAAGSPRDACSIFLVKTHDSEAVGGNLARLMGAFGVIDMSGQSSTVGGFLPSAAVQSAATITAGGVTYEVCIDVASAPDYADLEAGTSLGFDVLLTDVDGDTAVQHVAWGPGSAKLYYHAYRTGDVILSRRDWALGSVAGQARWTGNNGGISFATARLQSTRDPRLWCTTAADTSGLFRVALPAGEYRVQLADLPGNAATAEIRPGQETDLYLEAPLPSGERLPAGPGTEHWRIFDVTDGLASNSVASMHLARDGVLWLGTESGLTRYDGREFTSYTRSDGLTQAWIADLAEDGQGRLWIAADTPGSGWDLYLHDGVTFTSLRDSLGLPGAVRSLYCDPSGHMWLGTLGSGVGRWDGVDLTWFTADQGLANDVVSDIWGDLSGDVWIATAAGVSLWDGQSLTPHRPGELGSTMALCRDRLGRMWYATRDGLLRAMDGHLETLVLGEGAWNDILALREDRHGRMWVGTRAGVTRFELDGTVSSFVEGRGLDHGTVSALLEDGDGHMWAGTGWFGMGGGVTRFSGERFVTFGVDDGLPTSSVSQAIEDSLGHLWIATTRSGHNGMYGLSRYDGQPFTTWTEDDGLRGERPQLLEQGGDIWVGVQRFDGTTFQAHEPASGSSAWGLARRPSTGDLWMAVWTSGVAHVEGQRLVPFAEIDQLNAGFPRTLVWDRRDRLWIGTWYGGLHRWDPATGETRHFGPDDGLLDQSIMSVTEDRDGRIWVGTWTGGVSWLDGEHFTSLSQRDGLACNWVTDVVRDRQGRYVISTLGGGVSLYDGLVMQNLTAEDGLGGNVVADVMEDSRGDLWFSTNEGLTRYRTRQTKPYVRLTGVSADREYGPVPEVRLSTTQDLVGIRFEGRSFLTPADQLAYVYRLSGSHDEWQVTRREQVTYENLPAGDYVFEVKAVDGDLSYSEPARVRVVVHFAYGRLALVGALAIALVGLVVAGRYGLSRRHERDQARTELVQERRRRIDVQPHEIERWTVDDFVGASPGLQTVLTRIRSLQGDSQRVLVTGEAGTGKELVARAIHSGSERRDGPFVAVRCAGLPREVESLDQRTQVLSLLFGHTRGAFAGADEDREGLVQQADGGILYLDEAGLLPLPLQAHLLRVLSQGEVRRTGSQEGQQVDLRVIAATSEDLQLQVQLGTFSRDLLDYLGEQRVALPPLRERLEDIVPLAQLLADGAADRGGFPRRPLAAEVLAHLQGHSYPGNVRELAQRLERAVTAAGDRALTPADLGLA